MNEQQAISCQHIFEAVARRPVARLFWDVTAEVSDDTITKPLSLSYIKEKLDRAMYPSPAIFINDMRQVFINGDTYDKDDSLRPHAVAQLMQDFEKAVIRYAPTSSSLEINLQISIDDIQRILHKNFFSPKDSKFVAHSSKNGKKAFSRYFHSFSKAPDTVTREDLSYEMSLLKSPILLVKIITFIHSLQPEVVHLRNGISILTSLISDENLIKIHEYIYKTLHDAAIGEIETNENMPKREHPLASSDTILIQSIQFDK